MVLPIVRGSGGCTQTLSPTTTSPDPPPSQGGRPHELDPHTLETIGESRVLDDVIAKNAPLAAHYRCE